MIGLKHMAVAAALTALASPAAAASVDFYSDYASWSAAVTGIVSTTVADPGGPDGFAFHGTGDVSVDYDGIRYRQLPGVNDGADLYTIGVDFSGSPAVVSSQTARNGGVAHLAIGDPVNAHSAYAFNFGVFSFDEGVDYDVHFEIQGSEFGAITRAVLGESYEASSFFGVVLTGGGLIGSVRLTGDVAALNVRDVQFADALPVGVPEPATWALMLLGFGGLGAALRQRRSALPAAQ